MSPPIWRVTLINAAGLPLPVTNVRRSAVPSRISAMSRSRTGLEAWELTTVLPISSRLLNCELVSARYC